MIFQGNFDSKTGDFSSLIRLENRNQQAVGAEISSITEVHGTTVIAVKYQGGVLNVGDRRATAANAIMYDKAEKVIALDDNVLIAISGAYGKAVEVVRYLRHAFRYYQRSQLQPMSLEGKLQEVSRAISGNMAMAMQGIGMFLPLISAYDPAQEKGRIFYFDGMGARFESDDYSAVGSGSDKIRGVFDYIYREKGPFAERPLEEALYDALILLDIAAGLDSATGGYAKILPTAKTVSADGAMNVPEETMIRVIQKIQEG